jgi:NADP-dependent 3-hydroxy acid dehydrogenase YdfG
MESRGPNTIVITGASGGNGRATARELALRQWRAPMHRGTDGVGAACAGVRALATRK